MMIFFKGGCQCMLLLLKQWKSEPLIVAGLQWWLEASHHKIVLTLLWWIIFSQGRDDHDGDGVSWFVFMLFSQDQDVCVKNL